jgi:hypothetical protein
VTDFLTSLPAKILSVSQLIIIKAIQNKLIQYFGCKIFFNGYADGAYKYHCARECIIHITVVKLSENFFQNYGAKILLSSAQVRRILK